MPYQQFAAPAWQTSRISALSQQFAAPQIGRLKRKMTGVMAGMGYDPQSALARRSAIRGYGEGLGGITAGAGERASSQYGQEYAKRLAIYGGGRGGGGGGGIVPPGQGYRTGSIRTPEQEAEVTKPRQWIGQQRKMGRAANPYGFRQRGGRVGVAGGRRLWRPSLKMLAVKRGSELEKLQEQDRWHKYLRFQQPYGRRRTKGGRIQESIYMVGEKGPELVKYDSGRFELVGTEGPEVRTFVEKGTVIPAGKTKKILKRKRGGKVGPKTQLTQRIRGLTEQLQVKELEKGLEGGGPSGSIMKGNIMRYLTSTRMDPGGGAGHMPWWQFMLQRQPKKLAGMLSYMQGGKFSFGVTGGSPTTRESGPRPPTQYPGGGQAQPSLEYEAWLKRKSGRR